MMTPPGAAESERTDCTDPAGRCGDCMSERLYLYLLRALILSSEYADRG